MQYKKKLLELLADNNADAFTDWLKLHSPIEQVEIMKQFKQLSLQNMFKNQDFSKAENLKIFDKKITAYEEAISVEIEVKALIEKVHEEKSKILHRLAGSSRENKQEIIDSILKNDEHGKERKILALEIIAIEKENGTFDPDFWKSIL